MLKHFFKIRNLFARTKLIIITFKITQMKVNHITFIRAVSGQTEKITLENMRKTMEKNCISFLRSN